MKYNDKKIRMSVDAKKNTRASQTSEVRKLLAIIYKLN